MIRTVIADDLEMVRTGFRMILENEDDMTVVGTASNGLEAIQVCRGRNVDVVLMDIRMPELDGIAATAQLMQEPDPPSVLVLTTFGLDEYVTAAIRAGASGFLLKDASADEMVAAVRAVARGDASLSPSVARIVIEQARQSDSHGTRDRPNPGLADLTSRERDVLQQLTKGLSNAEIADSLYVSEATIKTHLGRVLTKLGVRDRVQAVIAAYEGGLATDRGDDPTDMSG